MSPLLHWLGAAALTAAGATLMAYALTGCPAPEGVPPASAVAALAVAQQACIDEHLDSGVAARECVAAVRQGFYSAWPALMDGGAE